MIASIDTGYLVTPRILEESTVHYEPLNIAHSTRLFLQDTMKEVVNEGTARILANLKGFEVFAKTSTAQTSDLEKRDMGEQYLEHGWVAVNFKYKNEPTMTMVVLVENAGSAALSLMIARAF
jgi:cell division protein FtsI/penicillin-binding protein 2